METTNFEPQLKFKPRLKFFNSSSDLVLWIYSTTKNQDMIILQDYWILLFFFAVLCGSSTTKSLRLHFKIKELHHHFAKIYGLENLSLWLRINSPENIFTLLDPGSIWTINHKNKTMNLKNIKINTWTWKIQNKNHEPKEYKNKTMNMKNTKIMNMKNTKIKPWTWKISK